MRSLTTDFAIYSDCPTTAGAVEMQSGLVPRIFSRLEAEVGTSIHRDEKSNYTEIFVAPGTYRISGFSMITMQLTAAPIPVPPNTWAGYCVVYDAANPPKSAADTGNCIGLGSPGTAFDSGNSLFDCVFICVKPTKVSVGHQCSYPVTPPPEGQKAYLRVGFPDSLYHAFARIAIFKIADVF